MSRPRWHALLLLAALILSGCAGPQAGRGSSERAGDTDVSAPPMDPLPDSIHDGRDVAVSASGSGLIECGDVHQCVDHEFNLPRPARLVATLSWGVPSNVPYLQVLQDGQQVAVTIVQPGSTSVTLTTRLEPGDYVLRVDILVMAADRWELDAVFEEPAPLTSPFGLIATAVEPCGICYEPSVAVDLQGRIFASDGGSSGARPGSADFGRSIDGGKTFERVTAPPPVYQPPPGTSIHVTDILVQVAPSGRLYWSALVIVDVPGYETAALLEGIQVAWSDDGGQTWAGNVHLDPFSASPVFYPDRQWLGFGQGETVYMTYNQAPTGIWISRSDDGGLTWAGWTRAIPLEERDGGMSRSGPPVVGDDGTVYVAGCTGSADSTVVYRSADGGQSFASTTIGGGCWRFPMLATRGDDLVLATNSAATGGNIIVAWSRDAGVSFSTPVVWGEAATVSPWPILLADGSLALAWFHLVNPTQSELHLSRGVEGPQSDTTIATIDMPAGRTEPAVTDFASAAVMGDGRMVLTWMDGARVLVTTEGT